MYAVIIIISFISGYFICNLIKRKELEKQEKTYSGIRKNEEVLNQWMVYMQNGISLDTILKEWNVKTVAIYGMGIMGRHILRDLANSDIVIKYGIDNKKMSPIEGVLIQPLSSEMEAPDLVINSVLRASEKQKIEDEIQKVLKCKVISLDTLLFDYNYL